MDDINLSPDNPLTNKMKRNVNVQRPMHAFQAELEEAVL